MDAERSDSLTEDAVCPFCRIARGDDANAIVVFEDERTIVFPPLAPAARGHLLVVPKKHFARVWDLTEDDADAVMRTVVKVSGATERVLRPAGLNLIQSNGAAATQTVDHVHVHIVPRWRGDRLVLRWPRKSQQTALERRDYAASIRSELGPVISKNLKFVSSDDRRQHLSFIQSVISRMAAASASAKTWLLPIVTAAFGYAFVEKSLFVALLGIVAVIVFALLDANYLKQERAFRGLYDRVSRGESVPAFSMNPTVAGPAGVVKVNYWPDKKDWWSWAIAPFYLPMIGVGVLLLIYLMPLCSLIKLWSSLIE
ncbi:HIT family protein [Microbacterium sp. NPDC007973]|uniref:HIT family protein n=1 Tax=Microbacterium sp. NPDC007973 TaxID=3364182 RepID=UPI0036EA9C6D